MRLIRFVSLLWLIVIAQCFHTVCYAQTLDASVGWTKPPYVIEIGDTGFELELLKAIFKQMGYGLEFLYVPFGRANSLLNARKVDLALTMNPKMDLNEIALSEPYIIYQNAAISLKGRIIQLNSTSQLRAYSVVGFQNASIVLGEEYVTAINKSPLYLELPDQKKQVEMLLKGKADVVIMDVNIFNYLSREITGASQMLNVDVHTLFPPSPYQLGFSDEKLRDAFNHHMTLFKQTDEYQVLLNQYEMFQY